MAGREETLDERDQEVIRGCLRAAVEGPIFPDWEFQALFGLDRDEVSAILAAWPGLPDTIPDGYTSAGEAQRDAVKNTLNNLLGYPHDLRGETFLEHIGASEDEVARALVRWRGDSGFDPSGKGYFDRLT